MDSFQFINFSKKEYELAIYLRQQRGNNRRLHSYNEWNELKLKYKGIETEEFNIPHWQIDEVRERMEDYRKNPDRGVDFDQAIDEIEREL